MVNLIYLKTYFKMTDRLRGFTVLLYRDLRDKVRKR